MKSVASAVWEGGLKDGKGSISASGGAFTNTPYSFAKRFEGAGAGTTPEELIAAAHAGCFAMATSALLGQAGYPPARLEVKATVTLQPVDEKPTVTGSHLELTATVPGIDAARFREIAESARAGCVISRLLNTKITLDAKLA
jgi:osmotically inducible protein OsmC